MNVDHATVEVRSGAHQFIKDHQQAVEYHKVGLQCVQALAQPSFEIGLARWPLTVA